MKLPANEPRGFRVLVVLFSDMDEPPTTSAALGHADDSPPGSTRAAEGLPRRRFTVAEVEAMVEAGIMLEDERVELIGGELVPMPAKGNRHELVKTRLSRRWYRAAPDAYELTTETTFRFSKDTYLEPDVVIYDAAIEPKDLDARTVFLVVEIASSSLRFDVGRKAALYASFGVRELWVIDAVRGTLRVFRSPTENGYAEVMDLAVDALAEPRFAPGEFALRLSDLDIF